MTQAPPPPDELPISDPTNPAHRLADDLRRGRIPDYAAADLRTVLSHLRQVEEREAVMREGLTRMANASENVGRKHFREEAAELLERTALTHSPETDGEG